MSQQIGENRRAFVAIVSLLILLVSIPLIWTLSRGSADTASKVVSLNELTKEIAVNPHKYYRAELWRESKVVKLASRSGESIYIKNPDYPILLQLLRAQSIPAITVAGESQIPAQPINLTSMLILVLLIVSSAAFLYKVNLRNLPNLTDRTGHSGFGPLKGTEYEKCTFSDIAGCEEAVSKLRRVARWLKSPQWYDRFGAKIPRGILAVGPPGTGKTLLARALASEVEANFFSVNGSSFVEMFVGVGARRVRNLFKKAVSARKKNGHPSIIFIDEIDAVGKKRGGGNSGSDSEREQTLNQLLVSMQGFESMDGILVMAATNRPDTLDSALTRPGRFDYRVNVDLPDTFGRERIFAIHTENKALHPKVDLRDLAIRTPLFSGADIEQVCNEAAIAAAERLERKLELEPHSLEPEAEDMVLTVEDFDKGIDYVQFGDPMLSRARSQSLEEKKNVAVHEAGHCAVQQALQGRGADPITKVTIEPRTKSMGSMQSHPTEERYGHTEKELRARIMTALGGRIAQERLLRRRDTGASNDFEQANHIARKMVTEFGMSKLGPIYIKDDGSNGDSLNEEVDKEVRRILTESRREATAIIKKNRKKIVLVARVLMEEQTILGSRFRDLWERETSF